MKRLSKLIVIAFIIAGASAHAQVVLQNFSNLVDGTNTFFSGTWTLSGTGDSTSPNANFSQGTGVFNFAGSTGIVPNNSDTSFVEIFNTAPVNIGANGYLSVTAQSLTGNASSSFAVFLYDTNGNSAYAAFDTSFFITGSYSTHIIQFTTVGAFNSALVDSIRVSGNQPGGSSAFAVSFDNISAVSAIPEPSTYAGLAGALCLGLAVWRRKRERV